MGVCLVVVAGLAWLLVLVQCHPLKDTYSKKYIAEGVKGRPLSIREIKLYVPFDGDDIAYVIAPRHFLCHFCAIAY